MRKPPYKILIASLIVILASCKQHVAPTSGMFMCDKALPILMLDIDMKAMTVRIYPNPSTSRPDSIPDFAYKEGRIEENQGEYYLVDINSDYPPNDDWDKVKIEILNENDILVDCAMISQILWYNDLCRGEELVMRRVAMKPN